VSDGFYFNEFTAPAFRKIFCSIQLNNMIVGAGNDDTRTHPDTPGDLLASVEKEFHVMTMSYERIPQK